MPPFPEGEGKNVADAGQGSTGQPWVEPGDDKESIAYVLIVCISFRIGLWPRLIKVWSPPGMLDLDRHFAKIRPYTKGH